MPIRQRIEHVRGIGVVFGQRTQLWWDLPLADSFELLHHVYRTGRRRHDENLAELVDLLGMGLLLATPVRQLSLGQRMRGELTARAAARPGAGGARRAHDRPRRRDQAGGARLPRRLNRDRGATVLLTTHDLDDVERLCERLMIIDHGHVIHDGGVAAFKTAYGTHRTVVVDLVEPAPRWR